MLLVNTVDIKQEPVSPHGGGGGRRWGEEEKGACLYEGRRRPASVKIDGRNDVRYKESNISVVVCLIISTDFA